MKVEFGAGGSRPDGWITHDIEVPIEQQLPYGDESVEAIRCEHCCEHVSGPEFLHFLDECRRILKPGGTLRICMPVLDRLDDQQARDIIINHGHKAAYTTPLIVRFLQIAGFRDVEETPRHPFDHHHTVIGLEKDDRETARIQGTK